MMIRLRKTQLGSAVLATLLWGACSDGGSLTGASGKKSAKGDKKSVENQDDDGDQEDEKSDAPVQIAGAFLAADCALDATAVPSALGLEVVGCAIVDKATKTKTTLADAKLGEIAFTKADGTRVVPVMKGAPASSRWHATTETDRGTFAAVKSIVASFDAGGSQHKLKSKPGEVLGKSAPTPPDPAPAPAPPTPPADELQIPIGGDGQIESAGEMPDVPEPDPESKVPPPWTGQVLEFGLDDWKGHGESGNWTDAGLCFHGPGLKFEDGVLSATERGMVRYRLAKNAASCGHKARIVIKQPTGASEPIYIDSAKKNDARSAILSLDKGDVIVVDFMGIDKDGRCDPDVWKPTTDLQAVQTKVGYCHYDFHFNSQGEEGPGREGDELLFPPDSILPI